MEKIRFVKVEAQNYRSYPELEFHFTPGKHLILGENRDSRTANSNASGKSCIVQSLLECIYKCTLRGKNPATEGKGNCKIAVTFFKNKDEYRIERYWKWKGDLGTNPKIFKNGIEISQRKKASSLEEIINIINISHDLAIMAVVVVQGLPGNFSTLGPTARNTMLEEVLGYYIWEELQDTVNLHKGQGKDKASELGEDLNKKKEKMISLHSTLEYMRTSAKDDEKENKKEIASIKKTIRANKDEITKLTDSLNSMNFDPSKLDILRENQFLIEKRINELCATLETGICQACQRPFPVALIKQSKQELRFLRTKMEGVLEKVTALSSLSSEAYNLKNKIREKTNITTFHIESLEKKYTKAKVGDSDIDKKAELLEKVRNELNDIKSDYDTAVQRISNLEYFHKQLLPSSNFRVNLLKKYLVTFNKILESVAPLFDVECKLIQETRGTSLEVRRDGKKTEYLSFSGGQQRRIDIILILSLIKFVIDSSGISTNLLAFDEIFDGLDRRGMECVMEAIDVLFPESKCIYVITHQDSFKSIFELD